MQKVILLAILVSILGTNLQAQTISNFSVTDLNGNKHDLYEYLDEGKVVVVDFFATWCGLCWNFHNKNHIESLNKTFGSEGDNSAVFLLYESDQITTIDDLQGNTSNSKGDWLSGHSIPVVNEKTLSIDLNEFGFVGYPSVFVIAPDKTVSADISGKSLYSMQQEIIKASKKIVTDVSNEVSHEIKVFPNPFKDILQINLKTDSSFDQLVVTDVHGKKILSKDIGRLEISLETEGLANGMYFINFYRRGKLLAKSKVVK